MATITPQQQHINNLQQAQARHQERAIHTFQRHIGTNIMALTPPTDTKDQKATTEATSTGIET